MVGSALLHFPHSKKSVRLQEHWFLRRSPKSSLHVWNHSAWTPFPRVMNSSGALLDRCEFEKFLNCLHSFKFWPVRNNFLLTPWIVLLLVFLWMVWGNSIHIPGICYCNIWQTLMCKYPFRRHSLWYRTHIKAQAKSPTKNKVNLWARLWKTILIVTIF